jgi:hypothetical protein
MVAHFCHALSLNATDAQRVCITAAAASADFIFLNGIDLPFTAST